MRSYPSTHQTLNQRIDRVLAEARYKDIAPRKKKLLKFLARQYVTPDSTIEDIRRVLRTLKASASPGHQLGGTEDAVKEKIKKYIKSTTPSVIDGFYNRFIIQQARPVARKQLVVRRDGGGGGGGGSHTPTSPLFYTGSRVRSGYQQFLQDGGSSSSASTSASSSTIGRGRSTEGDQQLQRALRASIQTKRKQDLRHPRPPHAGTAIMTLPLGGAGGGVGGKPYTLRSTSAGSYPRKSFLRVDEDQQPGFELEKVNVAFRTDPWAKKVQQLFTNRIYLDQQKYNDRVLQLIAEYNGNPNMTREIYRLAQQRSKQPRGGGGGGSR